MIQDAIIRPQQASDSRAVRNVNEMAFGQVDEADLVEGLQTGGFSRIALVAEQSSGIVGAILFSELPIETASGTVDALSLAPLAVSPSEQRKGIGSKLVRAGLEACRDQGHRIVIVLGDPNYYGRFGFTSELAKILRSPFSRDAFQAIELVPDALRGVEGEVRYPPPFGIE